MVVHTRKETLYNKEASVAALLDLFERDNGKVKDAATWTSYIFLPFELTPLPHLEPTFWELFSILVPCRLEPRS